MEADIFTENSAEELPILEKTGAEEALTRRGLLKTAAASCLLLALPMLAEAVPPAHWEKAGLAVHFKTGITTRTVLPGGMVIFVTRHDTGHLSALSSICTHQGCEIGWSAGQKQFICPCHGSRFSAVGGVLHGPAHRPLGTFSVMQKNGQVLVDVGTSAAAPKAA
jgi:Rieske Fe-S protein